MNKQIENKVKDSDERPSTCTICNAPYVWCNCDPIKEIEKLKGAIETLHEVACHQIRQIIALQNPLDAEIQTIQE